VHHHWELIFSWCPLLKRYLCVCVCTCMRACMCACARTRVRARVCVCVGNSIVLLILAKVEFVLYVESGTLLDGIALCMSDFFPY